MEDSSVTGFLMNFTERYEYLHFLQQASRGALHEASVNGQYEEVKKYLSSGCTVDVKDQVFNYLFEK